MNGLIGEKIKDYKINHMENSKKQHQRFDNPPYSNGRTACGINALIEVLQLPSPKLTQAGIGSIAPKISELSADKKFLTSAEALSNKLQEIIETSCRDADTVEKVMTLCEHKYHHLAKTSSLI